MINLDKINAQFDVKQLDLTQVSKLLAQYQQMIVYALLVISLLIAWKVFSGFQTQEKGIHDRITQARSKLDAIDARDKAINDLKSFKSGLPKQINEFELLSMVSDNASHYNVSITSLKPADARDMGLYDNINLGFTAIADNFKDAMLFIRSIERSNPPLRLNSWSGREDETGRVESDIELSSVHIHP